jgi:protein gp37
MAVRLKAMGQINYARGFELQTHDHVLQLPLKWKKPQVVFVNSMSDLFHEDVPEAFIRSAFHMMNHASWHTYQVLTKRSDRLKELSPSLPWAPNIWMGVTVESEKYLHRVDDLRATAAKVKFLSLEPLLGPLSKLNLESIDWAIVGGESGPGARPMDAAWVLEIRDICLAAKVPFFFKQWGGTRKKKAGRLLEGRTWDQVPSITDHRSLATDHGGS